MENERNKTLSDRLKKIQQLLSKQRVDAVLISSVSHISYLSGYTNFSKEERDGYLFITPDKGYILTHGIYSEVMKARVQHLELIEISRREPTRKILSKLVKKGKKAKIGIEEDNLTVLEYKALQKEFKNLQNFDLNLSRVIKSSFEIECISKACQIGDKAFEHILKKIKSGVTELNLAFELENFIRNSGGEVSFKTIVALGKNSAYPHHETGNTALTKEVGQIVLMDFGVKLNNYCSDMTRTVFLGKPDQKKERIYKSVLNSQKKAEEFIENQLLLGKEIKASDVDTISRTYLKTKNLPDMPHSLGHGIGLEVHERPYISPKSKDSLKEGMVFSLEPGVYIPEFGGVRIEDLYVI